MQIRHLKKNHQFYDFGNFTKQKCKITKDTQTHLHIKLHQDWTINEEVRNLVLRPFYI